MTTTELTVSDVLRRAADEIERRGLYQGDLMPPGADPATCPVCAIGAIGVAVFGHPDPRHWTTAPMAQRFLGVRAVESAGDVLGGCVSEWSDEEGRTAGEVTEMLRAAADEEDAIAAEEAARATT